MVVLSARRMQRLAERLQQMERSLERGGARIEDRREEAAEASASGEGQPGFDEELASAAARVGVELESVRRMDRSTLIGVLSGGPGAGGSRLWAAAEILFLDGIAARSRGSGEAVVRARWEKAAHLYRELDPALELPDGAAPPEDRLERIEERIAPPGSEA